MAQRRRLLRQNKRCEGPSRVIVLDTETIAVPEQDGKSERHLFRCAVAQRVRLRGGCEYGLATHTALRAQDFWNWLGRAVEKKCTNWVFAHNLLFDFTTLGGWDWLESAEVTWDTIALEPGATFLLTRWKDYRIWWVDTLNYFDAPLEDVARELSIAKLPLPATDAPLEEWVDRCRRDVEILRTAVLSHINAVRGADCGNFRLTIPSQAMQFYRHRFAPKIELPARGARGGDGTVKHTISTVLPLVHRNAEALRYERASYYGGPVHCYYIGKVLGRDDPVISGEQRESSALGAAERGPIYVLDVNSLYPAAMVSADHPVDYVGRRIDPTVLQAMDSCREYCSCAAVSIGTDRITYPLRVKDRTIYPLGKYDTVLAGPELELALKHGDVSRIYALYLYRGAPIFDDYVCYLWTAKQRARNAWATVSARVLKRMLTSLSGKFGQCAVKWRRRPDIQPPKPWGWFSIIDPRTKSYRYFRAIAWQTEEQVEWQDPFELLRAGASLETVDTATLERETEWSCPIIAAYVCSLARVIMRGLRDIAGRRNVYYSATDSLHCSPEGYRRLCDEGMVQTGELGMLELVGCYERAEYYRDGWYTLDGVRTIAGINPKAQEVSHNTFRFRRWETGHVQFMRGRPGPVRVSEREHHMDSTYRGGTIGPDGWTCPYMMPCNIT